MNKFYKKLKTKYQRSKVRCVFFLRIKKVFLQRLKPKRIIFEFLNLFHLILKMCFYVLVFGEHGPI